MEKKYKILTRFVKDMSVETNNAETYIFVKENIDKYNLTLNIKSNPLKNGMIGVDTTFKFEDKNINEFRSNFEVTFSAVVKLNNKTNNKEELEKILLVEVQNENYPYMEKVFLNMIRDAGFDNFKIEKKINFEELYKNKSN
tara:strand:+ start:260 stop:682 length:423 start_codon:yes stop_codon:yes gene_type:complete